MNLMLNKIKIVVSYGNQYREKQFVLQYLQGHTGNLHSVTCKLPSQRRSLVTTVAHLNGQQKASNVQRRIDIYRRSGLSFFAKLSVFIPQTAEGYEDMKTSGSKHF
jgi:hypothetical protein